jgi:hypothetical protein
MPRMLVRQGYRPFRNLELRANGGEAAGSAPGFPGGHGETAGILCRHPPHGSVERCLCWCAV